MYRKGTIKIVLIKTKTKLYELTGFCSMTLKSTINLHGDTVSPDSIHIQVYVFMVFCLLPYPGGKCTGLIFDY